MDSIVHGRSLLPLFEISRPPLKPPCWVCLAELDSNQASQASMISGVGFSNPKCRNMNFFTSPSLLFGVLKDLPVASVWLTRIRRNFLTPPTPRSPQPNTFPDGS